MKSELVSFNAKLTLYPTKDGGRSTPIPDGFRTDIKFQSEVRYCVINLASEALPPGSSASAIVHILLHDAHEKDYLLAQRRSFLIEGASTIGEVEFC